MNSGEMKSFRQFMSNAALVVIIVAAVSGIFYLAWKNSHQTYDASSVEEIKQSERERVLVAKGVEFKQLTRSLPHGLNQVVIDDTIKVLVYVGNYQISILKID